ncbi:MAG: hypothetical protein WBZ24_03190 [Anaerolineales bacterium]
MSDFAQQVSGWETFYLLTGTAAATLIGLLFVAISVGRESIEAKATRDLSLFGALTFNCFFYVLVISILFLIPDLSRAWLGLPLALLGLLALIGALIQWRAARSIPSDRFGMQVSSRFGAPMFSLILIIVIGFLILLGLTWSLYGLVVAVILLLASASQNAWFLLMLERS